MAPTGVLWRSESFGKGFCGEKLFAGFFFEIGVWGYENVMNILIHYNILITKNLEMIRIVIFIVAR